MNQIPFYSIDFESIGQSFVRAICHHDIKGKSCSSSVIISRPGVPNELGTMWSALGQPCQSIYVPFYVGVNSVVESFTNAQDLSKFYLIRDFAFGEYTKYQPIIKEIFDPGQETNYFLEAIVREKAIKDFKAGKGDVAKYKLTEFCYERGIDALNRANLVLDKMIDATVNEQSWSR